MSKQPSEIARREAKRMIDEGPLPAYTIDESTNWLAHHIDAAIAQDRQERCGECTYKQAMIERIKSLLANALSDTDQTSSPEPTEESACGNPCSGKNPCDECRAYWERMVREGLWDRDKGRWTDKGWKELTKV